LETPRLRVALVGCGPIADMHVLGWTSIPGVELVALCDRHPEHFSRFISTHAARNVYTDFAELLSREQIDAVDIATRPYSHLELVRQSAAAGKHVLCQKPFADTREEALEMIDACERAGVRLMVYENWRWFAWFQEIKKLLGSGRIGEIKYYRLVSRSGLTIPSAGHPAPILSDKQTYLKDVAHLLVYEFAIHLIDVARFLFGEADRVFARIGRMSSVIHGDDYALVVLDHGKVNGCVDVSWCSREPLSAGKSESLLIEGTTGSIILETSGRIRVVTGEKGPEYHRYDWRGETKLKSHIRVHEHFVSCLLEGRPFQTEARDNLRTLDITLKCYDSAAGNSALDLASPYA